MKHWSDEVSYFPSEGCWLPSRAGISPIEMSLAAVFNSIHRKLGWFIQFIEAVFSGDIQHARKKSLLVLIYLTWGGNMRETFPSWQVASKLLQGHPLCFKPLVITVQCVYLLSTCKPKILICKTSGRSSCTFNFPLFFGPKPDKLFLSYPKWNFSSSVFRFMKFLYGYF